MGFEGLPESSLEDARSGVNRVLLGRSTWDLSPQVLALKTLPSSSVVCFKRREFTMTGANLNPRHTILGESHTSNLRGESCIEGCAQLEYAATMVFQSV